MVQDLRLHGQGGCVWVGGGKRRQSHQLCGCGGDPVLLTCSTDLGATVVLKFHVSVYRVHFLALKQCITETERLGGPEGSEYAATVVVGRGGTEEGGMK